MQARQKSPEDIAFYWGVHKMQFTAEKVFRHVMQEQSQIDLPATGADPVNATPDFTDSKVTEVFIKFRADCLGTRAVNAATGAAQITAGNTCLYKSGESQSFYNHEDGKFMFFVSVAAAELKGLDTEIYNQGVLR
jgi:hypothetical protein